MPSPTVYLETFGCQMNELDSELVTGSLRTLGYRFTQDASTADVVLYNTCSVRELAEQKVWSRLGEMALRKAQGGPANAGLVVGVIGCMAEREGPALMKRMPVVDLMVGPGELDKLPGLLDNAVRTKAALAQDGASATVTMLNGQPALVSARQAALAGNTSRRSATLAAAEDTLEMLDLSRAVSPETIGQGRSAYVRITRGCNKFCTYCVVPFTRGAEVHRPPQHIIDECKKLADAGVIEVTLLGQTVNHYRFEHGAAVSLNGVVQPQKGRVYKAGSSQTDAYAGVNVTTFADLLAMIHERVPAIRRLRFVTSYPRDFGDDVLTVIRDHHRICRYLHVPAQSGSDRMLALMNRGYTVSEYRAFLERAKAILHQPEIGRPLTLAGDIIVGFPGETDADFAETAALLEHARYKNCFIFKYSPRPGTVAIDRFVDDVPDEVKRRRNNELLTLQNRISEEVGRDFVGQEMEVLIQGLSRKATKERARSAKTGQVGLTVGGKSLVPDGATCEHAHGQCDCASTEIHVEEGQVSVQRDGNVGVPAGPLQFTARTDGDVIVLLDSDLPPDDLIGTIRKVRIVDTRPLALLGTLLGDPIA